VLHTVPVTTRNLLGDIPPTLLPDDLGVRQALAAGTPAQQVAAAHPDVSLPWAALAEEALAGGRTVEGYAYARVGYHRGLDALRRSGWRGQGPVPWSHEPNRGFLRSLSALGAAAAAIGEDAERDRCRQFLTDCDPRAAEQIEAAAQSAEPVGPRE
jgi:hypothetical protein